MLHHEIEKTRMEPDVLHGASEIMWPEPGERKKSRKHIRLVCELAQYGDSNFRGIYGFQFETGLHFGQAITYFSTKWD